MSRTFRLGRNLLCLTLTLGSSLFACKSSSENPPGDAGADGANTEAGLVDDSGRPIGDGAPPAGGPGVFPYVPGSTYGNWMPSIAVDGAGKIHVAFANYEQTKMTTRYASCAASCTNTSSWKSVDVAPQGLTSSATQIVLDKSGHPRILFRYDTGGNEDEFRYATCDAGCETAAGWKVGTAAKPTSTMSDDKDVRSLALDPQGRPGFIWHQPNAVYYQRCTQADCINAAAWSSVALVTNDATGFSSFSLAFDSASHPHFALRAPSGDVPAVAYYTCSAGCDQATNFAGAPLFTGGSTGDLQLRLAPGDRPRLAYFSSANGDPPDRLVYAWCDSGCTKSTGWTALPVAGVTAHDSFHGMDLALDGTGRPRLSFDRSDPTAGQNFAACDSGCEGNGAKWTVSLVEKSSVLDLVYPIPAVGTCTGSLWFAGRASRLAIDPSGRARVVYGAEHQQGGACPIKTDKMLVRVLVL